LKIHGQIIFAWRDCLSHLSHTHELLTIKIVTKTSPGRLIKKGYYQFSFFRVLTEGQSGGYFDIITYGQAKATHPPLIATLTGTD
jgi:hypothetical protein